MWFFEVRGFGRVSVVTRRCCSIGSRLPLDPPPWAYPSCWCICSIIPAPMPQEVRACCSRYAIGEFGRGGRRQASSKLVVTISGWFDFWKPFFLRNAIMEQEVGGMVCTSSYGGEQLSNSSFGLEPFVLRPCALPSIDKR